jgi:hypothetical protein
MWYPHRSDHPDWPSLTLDSSTAAISTARGSGSVLDWANEFFEQRDERDFAEALADSFATHAEVAAIERAFDDAGFPVIVNPTLEFRSRYPELISWSIVLKAPLTVFLTAIATRASGDVYDAAKRWLKALIDARSGNAGTVTIEEDDRMIVISTDIPDDALRKLSDGAVPPDGYVVWDVVERTWRRH